MKKLLYLILIISMVTLSACSNDSKYGVNNQTNSKFTIVTSFYPIYIFTKNITKDISSIEVINLAKENTGCLHDYQLSPADIKILEKADVFIINGAGMENFLDKVISQLPKLKIIDSSKNLKLIKNKYTEENNQEISEYNPHVFVSISNAITQVSNIAQELIKFDPQNEQQYALNRNQYMSKLKELKMQMHNDLAKYEGKKIITFHEAFPYFADEFKLNIATVIEREPGSEPSAGELADTIDIVKSSNIKALFAEPQYPQKASQIIADETGAKVYTLDPVVTGDINNIDTYTTKMEENLRILKEALANE